MVLKIDEDEGKQPDMKKDDERIEKATIILIDAIDSIHGSVLPSQKIVWKNRFGRILSGEIRALLTEIVEEGKNYFEGTTTFYVEWETPYGIRKVLLELNNYFALLGTVPMQISDPARHARRVETAKRTIRDHRFAESKYTTR